jgi:hypothetical protein
MFVEITNNYVLNTDRISYITKLGDNQVRVRVADEFIHFNMKLSEFMEKIDPPSVDNK